MINGQFYDNNERKSNFTKFKNQTIWHQNSAFNSKENTQHYINFEKKKNVGSLVEIKLHVAINL